MLSERRRRILAALVEEYVAHATPVGSRTLTERYHLGVSPATVRNDLSALEDAGFITQPHTSAGRIPTDAGYRAFVDELLASEPLIKDDAHGALVDELKSSATELDELLDRTSLALSRLTDCLSVVIAPSVISSHIRQLSLISLTNYRALIVVVAEDGQVIDRQISFADQVTPDELARVQNLLNQVFAGKSLAHVRQEVEANALEMLADPLVSLILAEVTACVRDHVGSCKSDGMSSLMRKPEFSNASALLPIMQVLEDDTVLLHVFDETALSDDRFMVRIGKENTAVSLPGFSVVASQYGRGESSGVVAVIGPTRMNYQKVIRAVRAAEQALRDE